MQTPDIQLSDHFRLLEFTRSKTAIDHQIDNTPNLQQIYNLQQLCFEVLEPLRRRFGAIHITSGFRCKKVNQLVGGAEGSQHLLGEAADIFIPNTEILTKYRYFLKENCDFDQMILEPLNTPEKRWLHVSFSHRHKNRNQIL